MKKICFFIATAMCVVCVSGCEPAASPDELRLMCENLVKVRAEVKVPTVEELTAELTAEYKAKEEKLLAWKERDMKGWDEDLAASLKRLEEDTDQNEDDTDAMTAEKLKETFAKKKAIGAKQFDDDLLKLTIEKKARLAGVGDVVKEAQAQFDAKANECLEKAKTEKVSQSLAQCRIQAPDKDTYWNKCK
ncbi:MAG: hypothetical protein JXX14_18690 [Deltaproteobacteria bacterium]|nr:hypothetical protein [Deltaproteobacteria bacterium]